MAEKISEDSYALVFGINTFVAVLVQTALTLTVSDQNGLWALNERNQFFVYGGYHACLGVFFGAAVCISYFVSFRGRDGTNCNISPRLNLSADNENRENIL